MKNKYKTDYFNVIDTEKKAYFLGFIYADGCIYKRQKGNSLEISLNISIQSKDKEILEELEKELNIYPSRLKIKHYYKEEQKN